MIRLAIWPPRSPLGLGGECGVFFLQAHVTSWHVWQLTLPSLSGKLDGIFCRVASVGTMSTGWTSLVARRPSWHDRHKREMSPSNRKGLCSWSALKWHASHCVGSPCGFEAAPFVGSSTAEAGCATNRTAKARISEQRFIRNRPVNCTLWSIVPPLTDLCEDPNAAALFIRSVLRNPGRMPLLSISQLLQK